LISQGSGLFGDDTTKDKRELIDPGYKDFVPGTDGFGAYMDGLKNLDKFHQKLFAAGIDVENPDPSNPDALAASEVFWEQYHDLKRVGEEQKAGKEYGELYQKYKLQKGIMEKDGGYDQMGDIVRPTKLGDMRNLYNIETTDSRITSFVNDVNKAMKTYTDRGAEKEAAQYREGALEHLNNMKQEFAGSGIPDNVMDDIIETAKTRINPVTYDDNRDVMESISRYNAASSRMNAGNKQDNIDATAFETLELAASLSRGEGYDDPPANSPTGPYPPGSDPDKQPRQSSAFSGLKYSGGGDLVVHGVEYKDGKARVRIVRKKDLHKSVDNLDEDYVKYDPLNTLFLRKIFDSNSVNMFGNKGYGALLKQGKERGYISEDGLKWTPDAIPPMKQIQDQ
jgi:hypothetical protein